MNSDPVVSVLMTAFNREKYITAAIESVLASSFEDFELIIVDDGSKDGTFKIARDFASKDIRIRVYANEKNLGQFENRNKAAGYARGKYLKYVDSDDMILPETIAIMVAGMEQYSEAGIGLVYNDMEKINLQVKPYRCFDSRDAYLWHYTNGGLLFPGPTGCIFRKNYFFEQGGFPLDLGINGDIYLNLRIAAVSPVVVFPGHIVFWRKHNEQVDELQQDYFKMHVERYQINRKILLKDNLPIATSCINRIRLGLKILYIRGAFKQYLLKGNFLQFSKLLKAGNISLTSFPILIIPIRFVNLFKKK